MWNKNVALQGECPGVALDRNFDIAWNNNSSINSCNQEYPGPVPFSEAETRAVRDVFHRYSHKMAAYFHIHAGSYHTSIFKVFDTITIQPLFIPLLGPGVRLMRMDQSPKLTFTCPSQTTFSKLGLSQTCRLPHGIFLHQFILKMIRT